MKPTLGAISAAFKEYNWLAITVIKNAGTGLEKIIAYEEIGNYADFKRFVNEYDVSDMYW